MSEISKERKLFEKHAKGRTGNVIRSLRILRKSANSKTNEYTNDEAAQITAAIDEEVEAVRKLFQGATPGVEDLFDFDDPTVGPVFPEDDQPG